jgi:hypothetical protein
MVNCKPSTLAFLRTHFSFCVMARKKITAATKVEILTLLDDEVAMTEIAKHYDIAYTNVSSIKTDKARIIEVCENGTNPDTTLLRTNNSLRTNHDEREADKTRDAGGVSARR